MKITKTILEGCYVLESTVYNDNRGTFYEFYHQTKFEDKIGIKVNFVQDNISISKKGVLRGLHFQKGIHAQAKFVQVIKGEVLDVVVDLRKQSKTFGKHFKLKISSENSKSIFIPKGMAHGFLALTEEVVFVYKCDALYNKESEGGVFYKDPELNIDWGMPECDLLLSQKDVQLPLLKELVL